MLVLTWIRTFGQLRESWRLKLPLSVSGLLLRDGTCFPRRYNLNDAHPWIGTFFFLYVYSGTMTK